MTAREEILKRLRAAECVTNRAPIWRSQRNFMDPAAHFTAALTANEGEVYDAADLESAFARLGELLADVDARQIVANREPPLDSLDYHQRWPHLAWNFPEASPSWIQCCATAGVGVTAALAAFAETGSVVISSEAGRSRLVSLLPPIHVVLLSRRQITTDIFTWMADRKGEWPANVVFVSGPSKSADIEQTLTVGVHGPRRFVVILFDE
jgi:L-lactate dehydrogenase complex protein LldG